MTRARTDEAVGRSRSPLWSMVFNTAPDERIINHQYTGSGTKDEPYVVCWLVDDPQNPLDFRRASKWTITVIVSLSALVVALVSSAYTGGMVELTQDFNISEELALVGVSMFVVGFAVGPLLWAPLSETYGRRPLLLLNAIALTALTAGVAASPNIESVNVLRFLGGSFGSAPLAIAGGVIVDLFPAVERGLAAGLYGAAPFIGPALGPIIGGYLSQSKGWRAVEWLLTGLSGAMLLVMYMFLPETYAPALLAKRAELLSKATGQTYQSALESNHTKISISKKLGIALSRPWILLFREPIVLLLALYLSIIYGTLYMLFAAYPIVFEIGRGWGEGTTGLTFVGVMVGILIGTAYTVPMYFQYRKKTLESSVLLLPEARLPDGYLGAVALPVGLFMFAWTNSPSIHWAVPVIAGMPFGFGMLTVFLSVLNYLVDAYTIYAASVLASTSLLRCIFGAAFPLFTGEMYKKLGLHWAASIPAFLALACLPMPLLLHRYGPWIRERCHYAADASATMKRYREMMMLEAEASRQEEATQSGRTSEEKGPTVNHIQQ
ncbi:hypothetical protein N7493_005512 [Penicillium malachiteum]|uniref:Major facilitator superfamily (MFS) profile domain-containing protein n=1 Tax=Penicillium malachiteum TaxID=1324776 RepID=A0AAD6MWW4_9EURO|nr:hypothetical protein N7493_005512 [Penicillium malachiteum]